MKRWSKHKKMCMHVLIILLQMFISIILVHIKDNFSFFCFFDSILKVHTWLVNNYRYLLRIGNRNMRDIVLWLVCSSIIVSSILA